MLEEPLSLLDSCLWFIEYNYERIQTPFSILPGFLVNYILSFMLEQRKIGSRVLDDRNIDKFFLPTIQELNLESFWITDKPFLRCFPCSYLRSINLNACLNIGDGALQQIATVAGPNVEVLKVLGCKKITNVGLNAITKHCTNLQVLQLDCLNITNESFVNIQSFSDLRQLTTWRMNQISLSTLAQVLSNLPNLEKLCCKHSGALDSDWNTYLTPKSFPNIKHLSIFEFDKIKSPNFSVFGGLISLKLSHCKFIYDIQTVAHCTNLRSLKLIRCEKVANIEPLKSLAPGLTDIVLNGCKKMTVESVTSLLKNTSSLLTTLSLHDCRRITLNCVDLSKNVNLRKLDLGLINSDHMLPNLFSHLTTIQDKTTILTPLFLNSKVPIDSIISMDLTGIILKESFTSFCPNIEILKLEECQTLTDKKLSAILGNHENDKGLPNLKELNLTKCITLVNPQITHNKIEVLYMCFTKVNNPVISCPLLHTLDITGSDKITTEVLIKIFKFSGDALKNLWVTGVTAVNDEVLTSLPIYARQLGILNVSNTSFSYLTLYKTLNGLKKMRRVYVNGCTQISTEDFQQLQSDFDRIIFTQNSIK